MKLYVIVGWSWLVGHCRHTIDPPVTHIRYMRLELIHSESSASGTCEPKLVRELDKPRRNDSVPRNLLIQVYRNSNRLQRGMHQETCKCGDSSAIRGSVVSVPPIEGDTSTSLPTLKTPRARHCQSRWGRFYAQHNQTCFAGRSKRDVVVWE